jgi:hypothetical protein
VQCRKQSLAGQIARRRPRRRCGLAMMTALVTGLLMGATVLAPAAPAAPSDFGSAATHYHACDFLRVDGWPVSGVSVRNVSCAHAQRLLDRFAHTNQGLGCDAVPEHHRVGLRCYARVRASGNGSAHRRYVEAVIVIAVLPECPSGDCGI